MKLRHNKIHLFLISLILVANLIGFNPAAEASTASAGSLIKMNGVSSVYYLGDDNKRYVFPSEAVFFSWYKDFNGVITVPTSELQAYPLGGNIVMRAGTKLVKITTDPSVYAVEPGGVLRKIKNEAQAKSLFGDNWAKRVGDVPDSLFTDYSIGNELADDEVPAGSLVKEMNAETYYYFDGAAYKKISSADAFLSNRFYSEYIIQAKQSLANQGESISTSNQQLLALIKWKHSSGSNQVNNGNVGPINPVSGGGSSGGSSGGGSSGGSSGGGGGSSGGGGGNNGSPVLTCTGNTSQSCTITNGLGSQNRTCSNGAWSGWGQCNVVSCNASYQVSGNVCVPTTCSGSSTQSCAIANGQGTQTRTCSLGEWSTWGSCTLSSCDSGYTASGNACVLNSGNLNLSNLHKMVNDQDFAIPSNAENGDVVGSINTFWKNWENRSPSYSIVNNNGTFGLDGNGKITLLNKNNLSGQSSIVLTVRAEDQAKQEYETAQINVIILPAANTYFIDPSVAVSGDGSKSSPYKNWSDVSFASNRNYLQKRGTNAVISNQININNFSGVTVGAYGNSDSRPKITGWNLTGSSNGAMRMNGSNNTIRDLDIDARLSTSGIYIGSSSNNKIDNCLIQNSEWAVRTMVSGSYTKIINSEIAYIGDDGHYNQNHNNLDISYNYFHHVNQKWDENSYWYSGKAEAQSPGDAVQLNGTAFDFNIHHNIFDRSHTDNKFCVLIGLLSSPTDTHGLIEHNYCKLRVNGNESGFYVERGAVGVKVRYNTVAHDTGVFTHAPDLLVAYNIFINSRVYTGEPGASYKVYNNVFYGPPADSNSVSLWTDNIDMKNNIFFFTNDTTTGLQTSSQHTVSTGNNVYYPNFRGAGSSATNIIANPSFVDAANNNFRLQAGSPAIGAGVNVGETHDFYGNALGSSINIGASQ